MEINTQQLDGKLYSLVEFYGRYYASFFRRNGKGWTPKEQEVCADTFQELVIANYGRLDAANSDRMVRLYI